MIRYSNDEWEQMRVEVLAFRGTLLHAALRDWLAQRRATELIELDSSSTDYARTQYLRGVRRGLELAATAIDDLERQAKRGDRHAVPATRSNV